MVFIRLLIGMESFGTSNIYHQSQLVSLLHRLASIFLVEVCNGFLHLLPLSYRLIAYLPLELYLLYLFHLCQDLTK